jgi:hypothetical protein
VSFPNIPNVTAMISITTGQAIDLLLSSIAFEELGLAHILNAEGEKIQSVLGTLPGLTATIPSISNLEAIDTSVSNTLHNVIKKEMLLEFKLEDLIQLIPLTTPSPTCPCTITFDVRAISGFAPTAQTVNGDLVIISGSTIVNLGPVTDFITACNPAIPLVVVVATTVIEGVTITFSVIVTPSGPTGSLTTAIDHLTSTLEITGTSTIMCDLS